jgi:uncharacterized protein YcfJ
MNEQHSHPGKTEYDWINGMRIGIITGALLGLLVGLEVGGFPFVWFIIGAASGGFLGAKMAPRW